MSEQHQDEISELSMLIDELERRERNVKDRVRDLEYRVDDLERQLQWLKNDMRR